MVAGRVNRVLSVGRSVGHTSSGGDVDCVFVFMGLRHQQLKRQRLYAANAMRAAGRLLTCEVVKDPATGLQFMQTTRVIETQRPFKHGFKIPGFKSTVRTYRNGDVIVTRELLYGQM